MEKPKRKPKFSLHIKLFSTTNIFNKPPSTNSLQVSPFQKELDWFFFSSFMSLLMILFFIHSIYTDQLFLHEGRDINAQVVGCVMRSDKNGSHASVDYTYKVDDQIYSGWAAFSGAKCEIYPEGASLPIIYIPSDPTQSRITKTQELPVLGILLNGVMIFGFMLIPCIALRSVWSLRRRRRVSSRFPSLL